MQNEFGKLKKIVVGNELAFSKRAMDFTFKNMYKENLKLDSIYNNIFNDYELNTEILKERSDDLNNLAKFLGERGIDVIRPKVLTTPQHFTYNGCNVIESAASNVRDLCFSYGDYIIETPVSVMNRIHENKLFINDTNKRIIKMVQPLLNRTGNGIDTENWETVKDRINDLVGYPALIDAANMIKINNDIICNVGSINQYNALIPLKNILRKINPNVELHIVYMADSHIDGTLLPLKEGVFLANEKFLGSNYIKDNLPKKFKNWDIIYAQDSYQNDRVYWDEITKNPIALASSRGMDINVLSLNRSEILINDDAVRTADLLYKNGFQPIPIQFRHGEIFAGGIHCSTLDLERDN